MLYALILAGGVGSRLWPKSRDSLPKQFLNLTGVETMLQIAVRRISPLVPPERIFVATGERYVGLVKEQLPMLRPENIIAEMSGKNTAPAIGLGALHIAQADPQATMAVLTADHLISNETAFCQALQTAAEVAQSSQLVTLGITPTGPETGFGYIQRGEMMDHYQGGEVYKVKAFLEKPALPTAQKFCESGEYYWNSGMFIWRVATLFEALRQHMPTLAGQLEQLKEAIFNAETSCIVADIWPQIESESIDFGLMEKAQNVAVVPLNAGWNDVGNWAALYYELAQELGQNVSVNAQHLSIDSQGVLVQGNGKLVVTIGLENVAIIETDDAILVCAIDKTQDVKKVVEHLKTEKKEHYL
jgi:mannose-1-phosphate guanylyltransferase